MKQLLNTLNDSSFNAEFSQKLIDAEPIFKEILTACGNTWLDLCGSYLFDGVTYQYDIDMYTKQLLLYEAVKKSTHVLEIGTYVGHSLLIMLLGNPKLKVITIDISSSFGKPSSNILKKYFPEAEIHFIQGDSLQVLPKIQDTFNLFHIDGHHANEHITQEFKYCVNVTRGNIMRVIIDDIDCCRELENKILTEYKVNKHFEPKSKYSNCYFEISI